MRNKFDSYGFCRLPVFLKSKFEVQKRLALSFFAVVNFHVSILQISFIFVPQINP